MKMDEIEVKMEPETIMACLSFNEDKNLPTVSMHSDFSFYKTEPSVATGVFVCEESLQETEDVMKVKPKINEVKIDEIVQTECVLLNDYRVGKSENGVSQFVGVPENSSKQDNIEEIVVPVCVKVETIVETNNSDLEKTQTSVTNNAGISRPNFGTDDTSHEGNLTQNTKNIFSCNPHKFSLYEYNEKKPHKCNICGKCFSTGYGVTKHQRVHTGVKPYTCEICNKSLCDYTAHKVHMRTHTGEKPYMCSICNNSFSQKQHLKDHVLIHANQKPYSCEVCNKTFRSTSSLRLHKRLHTGEKPYTCDICEKSFARLRTLKVHMRIHTGEKVNKKPHTCAICDKVLSGIGSFKQHMRTHSQGKLSCDVCGKRFIRHSNLLHHSYIHTGERPYSCENCDKSFRRRTTLQQHLMIHTGAKPFACDICGHAFKQSQHLKVHMTTHSGIKPHPCTMCGKAFTLKYRLREHILNHMKSLERIKEQETMQSKI